MIGTLDVECQAKNPNLPLAPMTAFINSPSSLRIRNVPKRIGDWCIRNVYVTCVYPDSSIQSVQCVLVGGIWVGTIQGTPTSGTSKNGYTIFADGTDENGNNVTGYVLGKGDIEILEADGALSPDPARYTVKLLSAEATQPREGDMYPTDDGYVIWQDGQANLLGTPFEQITAYVESAVSAKADLSTLEDYIPYTIDSSGDKSALTIGTRKPDSSVGQFSFSTGVNNAAEAMQTVAMGFNNKALMQDSIAIGQNNNVAGSPAVAIGKDNKVSCTNGVSIGVTNTISGVNAVAIGTLNNANGSYAIAMGGKARANSDGSFTWSGSDKANVVIYPQYFDHGKGTFNVNPAGGLSGFYIGEQSLNDILSAKADLSAIPSNTSQLSNDSGYATFSDPYVGGWNITLYAPEPSGIGTSAYFNGRVIGDTNNRVLFTGLLKDSDVNQLTTYIDTQCNVIFACQLSDIHDGGDSLTAWCGVTPTGSQDTTTFTMADLYRR